MMNAEQLKFLIISALMCIANVGIAYADPNPSSASEVRIALVIGQSDYASGIRPIGLAKQESEQIAEALRQVNFKVTTRINLSARELEEELSSYILELDEAGDQAVGFVYYTGHGIQDPASQSSMLLGIDSSRKTIAENTTTVDLQLVADRLGKTGAKGVFLVFDACRNVLVGQPETNGSVSSNAGLSQIIPPRNVLIAYSTGLGDLAQEGAYAPVLAEELLQLNQSSENVFARVQQRVTLFSEGNQSPWFNSRSYADICFTDCYIKNVLELYFDAARDWLPAYEYYQHRSLVGEYVERSPFARFALLGYEQEVTDAQDCSQLAIFISVFPAKLSASEMQRKLENCRMEIPQEISKYMSRGQSRRWEGGPGEETELTLEEAKARFQSLLPFSASAPTSLYGDLQNIIESRDGTVLEKVVRLERILTTSYLEGPPSGSKALIVSQSDYAGTLSDIVLARTEGELIEASLEELGFDTRHLSNLSKSELEAALQEFEGELASSPANAVGFVYYTGHGIQDPVSSSSYLLGVDAYLNTPSDITAQGIDILTWTDRIDRATDGVTIFVFDACRGTSNKEEGAKSLPKGLARDDQEQLDGAEGLGAVRFSGDSIVLYAADIGMTAQEGVFAPILAEELHVSGRTIEATFSAVQKRVARSTGRAQFPWYNSSNSAYLCLGGCPKEANLRDIYIDSFDVLDGSEDADSLTNYMALFSHRAGQLFWQGEVILGTFEVGAELDFAREAFIDYESGNCTGLAMYIDIFPSGIIASEASQRLQSNRCNSMPDAIRKIAARGISYATSPIMSDDDLSLLHAPRYDIKLRASEMIGAEALSLIIQDQVSNAIEDQVRNLLSPSLNPADNKDEDPLSQLTPAASGSPDPTVEGLVEDLVSEAAKDALGGLFGRNEGGREDLPANTEQSDQE
ncbi:MAG: caspase family protein [Hyphomonadaceae bacterium]